MKRFYFSISVFAFFAVYCSANVFAQTAKVELTPDKTSYSSSNDIDAGSDYGILINQLESSFDASITNSGKITANDDGFGILGEPYPTRGGKVNITNYGTIENIQLLEFDGTTILNSVETGTSNIPILSGNILLGTSSNIANYGGDIKGASISFAYSGFLNNGVQTLYVKDEEGQYYLTDVILHKSILEADAVQFGANGQLSNGYKATVNSVKFGDNGVIVNVGDNFAWKEDADGDGVIDDENKAGKLMDTFSNFQAGSIEMGANGKISNEMGTTFSADSIVMGDGASIVNGADYALKYSAVISLESSEKTTVTVEDSEGNQTTQTTESSSVSDYELTEVPHPSSFHADTIELGANSTIENRKNSTFTGHDVTFGNGGAFNIQSGKVTLSSDANDTTDSSLTFGDNSTLFVGTELQEEITEPQLADGSETTTNTNTSTDSVGNISTSTITTQIDRIEVVDTVILPETVYRGELSVENIKMGNNSSLEIIGGKIDTGTLQMGDGANIHLDYQTYTLDASETTYLGELNATKGIYLGHFSKLNVGNGTISTPIINFLDDGKFSTATSFSVDKLNMGERSEVTVAGVLKSAVTLGSDSKVLVTNPVPLEEMTECKYCYIGGGIEGSLKKAPGAKNVTVVASSSDENFYTLLKGQIDVDSILVDKGLLEVAGDIKGNISLNTDTTLRLTGTDLYIHDVVQRIEGTTNTTVQVAVPDQVFYQTTNWMSAENLLVSNGGISVNNAVNFDNVLLGADTTIRLTGNYKVGTVKEVNDDSVNTTFEIAAGTGNSVNSSGSIHSDRVLISSGNFNVFHDIHSWSKSGPVTVTPSHIDGVELGTDASMTTFANVSVNQVLRNQELIAKGEEVSNTTLTVNADHFQVLKNVDIDNLNLNGGVFEFMNKDGTNAVNVTNDIQLKPYSALAGSGVFNIKSGHLSLNENARLAVSMQDIETQPISELRVVSSDSTIFDASKPFQTKDLTVETDSSGYIDVRASGDKNDKIIVDGTVNLADGTRVLIRDIQANQEYEILSAFQLNGNSDKLRTTFLWLGVDKKIENNALSLSVKAVQTLKEGIQIADHSKNVDELADTLTQIRKSEGAYSIDPFLDSVFFAETAEEAVKVLDEYSPEGYLNTMQASLRMQKVFKESVMGEMNAMRNYRIKHQTSRYYVKNPYYYGRPGHERYYYGFKEGRRNPYQERRSDRGGMWAKPFMLSLTQDDKDHQSGYDLNAYGFTAGIDRKVGVFTMGIAALYATGDMEQNNKNMQSDLTTYGLGVYGSITPHYSRTFMDFYALWSQTSVESKRSVPRLSESTKADFDMTAFTMGADIGYEILVAPNFILTPKIGLDYTSIEMDDVAENGNGRARVLLKGADLTSIQMPVEVKAAFDFGNHNYRFRPEFHARWTHEFGDTAAKSTANFVRYAAPFAVEGLNVDKDVFTVGGSLLWLYGLSEFELKYDYDFSSSSTGHSINMGYKYLF